MTAAPVGWLVAVAAVAVVGAALLSAGEAAVRRTGRSNGGQGDGPGRHASLLAAPAATASAAAAARVVLEVAASVCVLVALAATGMSWWQVLVLGLVVVGVIALVLIRYAPRTLGSAHPAGTLTATAPLLGITRAVAAPLHALGRFGAERRPTGAEFREMVDQASESELIEPDEREMFRSVLELGETITRAVMVPRTEMITLASGTRLRTALSLFLRSGYSRIPVVGESVDDLVGVLYLKDVVRRFHTVSGSDDVPVDELVRAAVFVPESKPADDLLRELQRGASHLAIVVDEFGGVAGLVTIEDALEEIVGELTDEHDQTGPEVEDLGDGAYRVPARLPLDELGELFGTQIDDDDVDTAGGLLAKALGKVPLAGSGATVGGLELTADRVEGRRKQVATLIARRAPSTDHEDRPAAVEGGAR